jgi:DnaK suppressor protein
MAAKKKVPTKSAKAKKPALKKPVKPAARSAKSARPAARAVAKPAPRKTAAKAKSARPATQKGHATPARKTSAPAQAVAKAKKPAATKEAAPEVRKPAVAPQPELKGPRAIAMPARIRRPALPPEDEEGAEPEDRHNLLLGPRNVTPYIERKGEQYMGKDQLDHFRRILESWKQDLMEEVDRTMTHMKDEAANPPDPNDRATLESEFALELRTRDRERKLIRKIEEALKRIEDGSYGYCLETGEPIGIKRLEARPVATLCIEAQERRERREKQYGDRDDWYR